MGVNFQCHTISNINEYVDLIKKLRVNDKGSIKELWFRGQANANWRLIPNALRKLVPVSSDFGFKKDLNSDIRNGDTMAGVRVEKMLSEFKRRAIPYLNYTPKNGFEWMFIAQHYQLPTRLLDWSLNPLIALHFALPVEVLNKEYGKDVEESIEYFMKNGFCKNDGAAIFIIDPCEINTETSGVSEPIDIANESEKWKCYIDPVEHGGEAFFPICVNGNSIDKRIVAQSGNFTLHGGCTYPLDYYVVLIPKIHKIFIPYAFASQIKSELKMLGITESFVFPDLEGLAKEIAGNEEEWFAQVKVTGEIYDYLGIEDN